MASAFDPLRTFTNPLILARVSNHSHYCSHAAWAAARSLPAGTSPHFANHVARVDILERSHRHLDNGHVRTADIAVANRSHCLRRRGLHSYIYDCIAVLGFVSFMHGRTLPLSNVRFPPFADTVRLW